MLIGDWEFCRRRACRHSELVFRLGDRLSARQWLRNFKTDIDKMRAMRTLALQENSSWSLSSMSEEEVIGQIAELLSCGRLHVHAHTPETVPPPSSYSSGAPASPPVYQRPAPPEATYREPASDPPTFSPDIDAAAQASTLAAAAASGQPFCPE